MLILLPSVALLLAVGCTLDNPNLLKGFNHSFFLFFIHHTESSEMGLDSFFLVGVELRVLDFYVVVLYM